MIELPLPDHSSLVFQSVFSILIIMLVVTKTQEARYIRVQEGAADGTLRITIPKVIAQNLDIKKQDTVRAAQEGNRIVVERATN